MHKMFAVFTIALALLACDTRLPDAHAQSAKPILLASNEGQIAMSDATKDQPTIPRGAKGKRAGPADVPAVKIGKLSYEVLHWGKMRGLAQNGGYLLAKDEQGKELWVQQIYSNVADPKLEADVQDVFITSLRLSKDGKSLEMTDEQERKYRFDPSKRKLLP